MKFNYRVVSEGETLLELEDMEISFIDINPIQNSHQAITMYSGVKTEEDLDIYDGVFSLYTSPFQQKDSQGLEQIFNVLLATEKQNKTVEVQVQPSEMDRNKDLPEVDFVPILKETHAELVTKLLRTESNGKVAILVFMVYRNNNK